MPHPDVRVRCFVIGCPRSGTTLVQAMLAAHPDLASFPETNYINSVIGDFERRALGHEPTGLRRWRSGIRMRLGVANRTAVPRFAQTMDVLGRPDLASALQRWPVRIDTAIHSLVGALDRIALDAGKTRWVEKSPTHYAYLDYIERHVAGARYLHVVRSGTDVVASLHDAAMRFPDSFWARYFADVEVCIDNWNRAVEVTRSRLGNRDHRLLRFEELLADPAGQLGAVCDWLGVPYHEAMVSSYGEQLDALRLPNETWKEGIAEPLGAADKFARLFDPAEQVRIRARLEPF